MSCFVEHCPSRYRKHTPKNQKLRDSYRVVSMFKVMSKANLNAWKSIIPNGHELTLKSFICEKHFEPHHISRYFSENLKDGDTFKLKRGKPLLLEGAMPSIFPDADSWIEPPRKRGRPSKRFLNELEGILPDPDCWVKPKRKRGRPRKNNVDELMAVERDVCASAVTQEEEPAPVVDRSMMKEIEITTGFNQTFKLNVQATMKPIMIQGEIAPDGSVSISSAIEVELHSLEVQNALRCMI